MSDINYHALCEAVAAELRARREVAYAEYMGSGFCVFVRQNSETEWICGTANECWGGDLIDNMSGELVGLTSQHIMTDVPVACDDPLTIAAALHNAIVAWNCADAAV